MFDYLNFLSIETLTWIGILFCITQSAMFSGLNLAFFSLNRLQLEVLVADNNKAAEKILAMRKDSNFLLTTILWGNIGINVLLTLLSNSVLAGVSAFLFSTIFITIFGEITPQAYFSRNALKMASMLAPLLRFYQIVLYVIAKPCAKLLDYWLGKEGVNYMREKDLRNIIIKHVESGVTEVEAFEGIGALNFLQIDDMSIYKEGEVIDPKSIVKLSKLLDSSVIPSHIRKKEDQFLQMIHASGYKWVVFTDSNDYPQLVLDADGFLRSAILDEYDETSYENLAYSFCHKPIVVTDPKIPLGDIITRFKIGIDKVSDAVIVNDMILLWADEKRIFTGSDLLGRLLKGVQSE